MTDRNGTLRLRAMDGEWHQSPIRVTATLMVFVDGKLEHTSRGLLRGDRLRAFLDRWGFGDHNDDHPNDADLSDDLNPWSNPRRWERGPIRDRIDDAKTRFAWWLLGKWLGFAAGGAAILIPWLIFIYRALHKLRGSGGNVRPAKKTAPRRRGSPTHTARQLKRNQ